MNPRTAMVLFALLSACSVGPDRRSEAPIEPPAEFTAAGGGQPPRRDWWRSFDDPVLDELVARALRANRDLAAARARVAEARAAAGIADAGYLPSVDFAADRQWLYASRQAAGLAGAGVRSGLVAREQDVHRLGVDASWEIDLFGAVQRRVEVAGAQAEAALAAADGVALRVVAEVVSAYVDLRSFERQVELADARVETLRLSLADAEAKVAAGIADASLRAAAEAALVGELSLPGQRRADAVGARWRLAVLLGEAPQAFDVPASAAAPSLPQAIGLGVPSRLLRRRPDVRAAEAELAAATAGIGVATADLYPRLFLLGSAGYESQSLDRLLQSGSLQALGGPSLRLPLFQGGRLRSVLRAAEHRERAALATFAQRLLQAIADVESLARRHDADRDGLERARQALARTAQLCELAEVRLRAGLVDREHVLSAERRRLAAVQSFVDAHRRAALSAVGLCKALGGGS